jgi:putative transposase
MPRQSRLVLPELPLHIVQRGNNRMRCFNDEADYLVYLALLRDATKRYRFPLHAYCLMGNHVHFLLTPVIARDCAAFMHRVSQRYAYYYNQKYARTGTLWEGRFRSCIVESSRYVLECHRYIELNPVRAGIVSHPSVYPWSSHVVTSGGRADPLVSVHPEVLAIGVLAYNRLLSEALAPALLTEIREASNSGYPLGDERFKAALSLAARRKVRRGKPGRPAKRGNDEGKSVAVPDLFSGGRAS